MLFSMFGVQISILGLVAVFLWILSMIILIYTQKMTWYVWIIWITMSTVWFIHYWMFQDVASLIDSVIAFSLNVAGFFALISKRKKKKKKGR